MLPDKKYTCIFFDLDHTLWDYETNSRETLRELYHHYNLQEKGVTSLEAFQERFKIVNTQLWELYDTGKISSEVIREQRFKQILEPFHAYSEKLSEDISVDYLEACPKKGNLMPYALEVLDYLHGKYSLSVITNGFEEIQHTKLTSGNMHKYFDHIVTSQKAGHKKPAKEIFEYALNRYAIQNHEAIMIGDNLITDIGGSRNASIDNIFYNPERSAHESIVTHEIACLSELRQIL
ncbi:MAG TPA: YjjG family noncanonical pyrimidine nucleotidase [Ohtaekwangia sp.]|uniref:YjjG family noncanonical pyrimidine nucleotidase n=1 Tax=Ohtaekwangia sp. TaxID=2066019 RepID=UPI002F922FB3